MSCINDSKLAAVAWINQEIVEDSYVMNFLRRKIRVVESIEQRDVRKVRNIIGLNRCEVMFIATEEYVSRIVQPDVVSEIPESGLRGKHYGITLITDIVNRKHSIRNLCSI